MSGGWGLTGTCEARDRVGDGCVLSAGQAGPQMTAIQQEVAAARTPAGDPEGEPTTDGLAWLARIVLGLIVLAVIWQGRFPLIGGSTPVIVLGIVDDTAGWHTTAQHRGAV